MGEDSDWCALLDPQKALGSGHSIFVLGALSREFRDRNLQRMRRSESLGKSIQLLDDEE